MGAVGSVYAVDVVDTVDVLKTMTFKNIAEHEMTDTEDNTYYLTC